MKLSLAQKWCISEFDPPLKADVLFWRFLKILPGFGPNSGYWCRVSLTLRKTLLNTLKTGAHMF
jgi:hypothetical protein